MTLSIPLAPQCHPETQTHLVVSMGSSHYLLLSPKTEISPSAGIRSRFLVAPQRQTPGHQQARGSHLPPFTSREVKDCWTDVYTPAPPTFSAVPLPTSWAVTCLPSAQHTAVGRDELALRIAEQHLVGAGGQGGLRAVAGRGQQLQLTACIRTL